MGTFFTSGLPILLSIAGWVIAGLFAVIGVFNLQSRQRQADGDQTADNLIRNLKTTTELQEKELTSLRAKEVEQGKEIAHLQGQVKVLADIFQGRDPSMQEVFKEAPHIFEIAKENNMISKSNGEAIANLTNAITDLLNKLEPIIPNLSQQTHE